MSQIQGFRRAELEAGVADAVPMYFTELQGGEARALRSLLTETSTLLDSAGAHSADPALQRLFPAMYPDSVEAEEQIRSYTHPDLLSSKKQCIQSVRETIPQDGGEVCLTADEAHVWLRALTDLRLVLAERIGVDHDTDLLSELYDAEQEPAHARVHAISLYSFLTFLSESLVRAVETEQE